MTENPLWLNRISRGKIKRGIMHVLQINEATSCQTRIIVRCDFNFTGNEQ
jgi:hypothetical protein